MRQRNHAPRFEEIAKMKLQAFRPSNPKSLQSQTSLRSKNRLPLNGLEGVHGRLIPGRIEDANLRCAIAHRGISRFRAWSFGPSRNDGGWDYRVTTTSVPTETSP